MSDNPELQALLDAAAPDGDRIAQLESQVKALQTTVDSLLGPAEVKQYGPCPSCGDPAIDVLVTGQVQCEGCGLDREAKALPEADLWADVEVKAAQLLGAADLDQLAAAHADLTYLLRVRGVLRDPADELKALDAEAEAEGQDDEDDPAAALVARRRALES